MHGSTGFPPLVVLIAPRAVAVQDLQCCRGRAIVPLFGFRCSQTAELFHEPLAQRDGWIGWIGSGAWYWVVSLPFPLGAVGWLRLAENSEVRGHASLEDLTEKRGVWFARACGWHRVSP